MGAARSPIGLCMGCKRRWQGLDTGVVRVQLQLRQCAMARGHGRIGALGKPDEPAERVVGRSMARFSRWHSIPADQGDRCAVLCIFEYAEHIFQCEDSGNVIVESQPPKTNWIRLAFVGDLYRNRDDASMEPEANQSGGLYSRQFDNRQHKPAPSLQSRTSGRWAVDGVCIRYGLWGDAEL